MRRSSGQHLTPMSDGTSLGVALFAGLLLVLVGGFHVLISITAIRGNQGGLVKHLGYAYQMDLTVWGWIHVATGVAAVLIGLGIMAGRALAYVAGLGVVCLSLLENFAFLPYAPIWSLLMISFDALVGWALVRELGVVE